MTEPMSLMEIVRNLDQFAQEETIYAAEPWTGSSTAIVAPEPESELLPESAKELGLKYFIEIFIARDFIEGWMSNLTYEPSLEEKCTRLIHYAIWDA